MKPRVRVVTLNYNGGELTSSCVAALRETDWPSDRLQVVLVDNASTDGVADDVEARWPDVTVVRSDTNRGFAGGMNLGLADLDAVDHVALVNNDVTVEPGWLAPLVQEIEDPELEGPELEGPERERVGAACPKILFATPFVEIEIDVAVSRRGRGDSRLLGARVSGARVGGVDVIDQTQLVHGFWGPEPAAGDDPRAPSQWTRDRARLRVPVAPDEPPPPIELLLESESPRSAVLRCGDREVSVALGPTPTWCRVPEGAAPIDVVNSAGAMVTADGYGADRGYLEPDDGRFDKPADVFAWSGAAALLSAPYLRDVGLFDERLFLYYEDLELSWRGQARGWRYRYTPASVVRHVHSATIGEHSGLARYQNERNRLLVLARHGDGRDARRAATRSLLVTASYARRDIVSPMLRGARPRATIVADRVRAFGGYARRLPSMLRDRRADGDR